MSRSPFDASSRRRPRPRSGRRSTVALAVAALLGALAVPGGAAAAPDGDAARDRASWRAADQYRAGTLPQSNVVADFTGDGDQDVAVTSFGETGLYVFPGRPSGRLRAAVPNALPGGAGAYDLATARFDEDELPDLAVYTVGGSGSSVVVLSSDGDGTFTELDVLSPAGGGEVAAGDVDGDGAGDVVLTRGSADGDVIDVYRNDGTGELGPPDSYLPDVFLGYDALTLVDVDGDGDLDLLYLAGCPTVQLNDGDGTFGEQICSTDPQGRIGGFALATGDFDHDGNLDIATGNASGERISISRGNGAGRFTFFTMYESVNPQLNFLVAGDVTGDREPDLVAGSSTGLAAILAGNGDGTFDAPERWVLGGTWLTLGDLGGSRLPEVVSGGGLLQNDLSVTTTLGKGRFSAPRISPIGGDGSSLEVGDTTGDGKDDVVLVRDDSEIVVFPTRKGVRYGGNPVVSPVVAGQTGDVELADLDEDGTLDAVGTLDTAPYLFVATGNGDGSFDAPRRYDSGGGRGGVDVADMDGDGHLDLVTAAPAQLSVAPGRGDGTLRAPILSGQSLSTTQSTSVDDMDGDGDLDVVAAIRTGTVEIPGLLVVVEHNDGSGHLTVAYERRTNSNLRSAAVGDLTGDGLPEVAVVGIRQQPSPPGRTGLFVWENRGGTLAPQPVYRDDSGTVSILITDVTGDGRRDVVTEGGVAVSVLADRSTGSGDELDLAPARLVPFAADHIGVADGDLDGDGRVDLVAAYGSIAGRGSSFAPIVNQTKRRSASAASIAAGSP